MWLWRVSPGLSLGLQQKLAGSFGPPGRQLSWNSTLWWSKVDSGFQRVRPRFQEIEWRVRLLSRCGAKWTRTLGFSAHDHRDGCNHSIDAWRCQFSLHCICLQNFELWNVSIACHDVGSRPDGYSCLLWICAILSYTVKNHLSRVLL